MNDPCSLCKTPEAGAPGTVPDGGVLGPVCATCSDTFRTGDPALMKRLVDACEQPLLVMQQEPRLVYTANRKALTLFGKGLHEVEGRRGGQVFDCIYAFTPAGCGKDEQCAPCRIKNAIVGTLAAGLPASNVSAVLNIKKGNGSQPMNLQISTQKIGRMALVRIDKYAPYQGGT